MHTLSLDQFNQLIEQTHVKPRLKRELRFVASTTDMTDEDWGNRELLPITDRTGNKGVLLIALGDDLYIMPYELSHRTASRQTGRAQPVICDLCRTWRSGTSTGIITFQRDTRSLNSVGYLCCADLACSLHVRSMTPAARLSRAQLRENLTDDQRVERLRTRLRQLVADLDIASAALE